MYQVAVCDDDPKSLKIISDVTENFFLKDMEKVKIEKYTEGLRLKKDVLEGKIFDIIITDIEMPDISGLDLAATVRTKDINSILIFVTAYEKYAVVGYEFSIFRYVPKGMLLEKLPQALKAAKQKINIQNSDIFMVENFNEIFPLLQKDILYIYREGKNSVIVTTKSTIRVRSTLIKTLEKLNRNNFFFIERGYIVNIEQISSIHKDTITMKNQVNLPIGSAHIQEVKRIITDYWKRKIGTIC